MDSNNSTHRILRSVLFIVITIISVSMLGIYGYLVFKCMRSEWFDQLYSISYGIYTTNSPIPNHSLSGFPWCFTLVPFIEAFLVFLATKICANSKTKCSILISIIVLFSIGFTVLLVACNYYFNFGKNVEKQISFLARSWYEDDVVDEIESVVKKHAE